MSPAGEKGDAEGSDFPTKQAKSPKPGTPVEEVATME